MYDDIFENVLLVIALLACMVLFIEGIAITVFGVISGLVPVAFSIGAGSFIFVTLLNRFKEYQEDKSYEKEDEL